MDSDALNTFLVVHRRGGISSAAKVLHRSQPAISRRIALLEQELGVPLFERVAGRARLSDAGRVMVPYAERAVAAAQDAENAVRALLRQNSGPVSLAVGVAQSASSRGKPFDPCGEALRIGQMIESRLPKAGT